MGVATLAERAFSPVMVKTWLEIEERGPEHLGERERLAE